MANKFLLLQDVDGVGRSGDVVTVKPGFARNYLLPKRFALLADARSLKMQAKLQEERKARAIQDRKEAEERAKKMEGLTIETVVKVDQDGHMFGSVSQNDIVHLLSEHGFPVERRMIRIGQPFKNTGTFTIPLKMKEDVPAEFTLKILPDRVIEEKKSPAEQPKA